MTGDNSHCTKTAHVKREGREGKEGRKKKKKKESRKKKKIKKPHHTAGLPGREACGVALGCAGMRWDALGHAGMHWDALGCTGMRWGSDAHPPRTHTHTDSQNAKTHPLGKDHPHPAQPSVHPAKQGAPKYQGHPLEQHQAQRQVDGHRTAWARGPSPVSRARYQPGTHTRGPTEIIAKKQLFLSNAETSSVVASGLS